MKKKLNNYSATPWALKEGVFLSLKGNYITRIRKGNLFETISQHKTKEEAEKAYNDFYKSKA